jgi:hypothetical protein
MAAPNSSFQRRYPPEMRERAVRMVREAIAESGERVGAVTRVARQLGIGVRPDEASSIQEVQFLRRQGPASQRQSSFASC